MATKGELIQAVNTAFSGVQKSALLQMLELLAEGDVDVDRLSGTIDAGNLPIATTEAVGVVSIGTGLDVDANGEVSVDAG